MLQFLGVAGEEHISETPGRFLQYLSEFNQDFKAEEVLGTLFHGERLSGQLVVQSGIPFRMACAHHLLPATGTALVGYEPSGKYVGLSKLTRLIDAVGTKRIGIQERVAEVACQTLYDYVHPHNALVQITAQHGCMACRGVNQQGINTTTTHYIGNQNMSTFLATCIPLTPTVQVGPWTIICHLA